MAAYGNKMWITAGMFCALACMSVAMAATAPSVPARKPTAPVAQSALPLFPDDVDLETSPDNAPAVAVVPAAKPATGKTVLPQRKPRQLADRAAAPKAGEKSIAGLPQKSTLLDRVITHIGGGRRLSEDDAARYAHIFAFQDIGDFTHADGEIKKLSDRRLLGHVLHQRYLHPAYPATYAELSDWMTRYGDHPNAQKIYDLAKRKSPGAGTPAKPRYAPFNFNSQHDFDVGQLPQPYLVRSKFKGRARDIIRIIDKNLSDSPTAALRHLETDEARKLFSKTEYDALLADIAGSYFYNGKIESAYTLATAAATRSGRDVPLAAWIAGLSSWRLGKYDESTKHFEMAANSRRASAWMVSAGAHWAARSHLRNHQPQKVSYWLKRAAEYPRTFYGIISLKALGLEQVRFHWDVPELTDKHLKALSGIEAGRRALSLVDAERADLAEQELRQINPGRDQLLREAMIALSVRHGMPNLAMRLGSAYKNRKGELYDAALYPEAPWAPEGGFEVDKALVYAFIRQESRFDHRASNRWSGAQGLMQLMPATARHVARAYGQRVDETKLLDPTVNIDLGQKYLEELLRHPAVGKNLFKLAVAYNAGPGKLSRWQQSVRYEDDPLLFIESIPVAETRIFVERVMTNYWIYRIKLNQKTGSLDDVVSGGWPLYTAQDTRRGISFADASEALGL